MIQMMLSTIGHDLRAQPAALRQAGVARKMMGLAIAASGFAVIFAQGLHHVVGL